MSKITENDRLLLEKFWEGRCNRKELHTVGELLDTEEGSRILFELFERRGIKELNHPAISDRAAERFARSGKAQLRRRIAEQGKRNLRPLSRREVLRLSGVAAAFVGAILTTGMLLRHEDGATGIFADGSRGAAVELAEFTNTDGLPELFTLPDGSEVWLAAGSTLKYPEEFGRKHRDVELTGEAFFDVERDEKRPFTIKTGELETRVLGTSFKITAFEGFEQEVAVATGKVSVSSVGERKNETKELALLTSGASVRHNPTTGETTRTEIDPTSLEEWKTGALTFSHRPMGLVAEQLENRCGIEIDFADAQIASRRMSGAVGPREPVADILTVLGIVGKFRIAKTDEYHYIIY